MSLVEAFVPLAVLTQRHVFLDVCVQVGPIKLIHHVVLELLRTNVATERRIMTHFQELTTKIGWNTNTGTNTIQKV
jgi:hypothetical protein